MDEGDESRSIRFGVIEYLLQMRSGPPWAARFLFIVSSICQNLLVLSKAAGWYE